MKTKICSFLDQVSGWLKNRDIHNAYSSANIFCEDSIDVDAAGFVSAVLERANAADALRELSEFQAGKTEDPRVTSIVYRDFFDALASGSITSEYWKTVRLRELEEGDIFLYATADDTDGEHMLFIRQALSPDTFDVMHSVPEMGVRPDRMTVSKTENGTLLSFDTGVEHTAEKITVGRVCA